MPSARATILQGGGKIELTRTRLYFSIPASRSAISKLVSFSLWRPTPCVRKPFVGTRLLGFTVLPLAWWGRWRDPVALLALRTSPEDLQPVRGVGEAVFFRDERLHPLQTLVAELDDRAAAQADQVLVVLPPRHPLVAPEPLAAAAPRDHPALGGQVERPVHRRLPHVRPALAQPVLDVVGREVARRGEHDLGD